MSLMTLYFPDEIDEHMIFFEIGDIVDRAIPHDEYIDEILAMSMSQIEEIVRPELAMPFNLFGVSAIEIAEKIQIALTPEFTEDDIVDVLFNGLVGSVERVSYFVDSLLSFDVLSRLVSHSDDVHDSSFMDLSIFEYLFVSLISLYLHSSHPHHRYLI